MHAQPLHPDLMELLPWIIYGLPMLLALAASIWGAAMIHVYRRDGRRQREHLCLKCGYDLRQTTTVCPECGEPVRGHKPDKPKG